MGKKKRKQPAPLASVDLVAPEALTDSHAHLDNDALWGERHAVLERARQAGVSRVLCIATDIASTRRCQELAVELPEQVSYSAGVHPHEAAAFVDADWDELCTHWSSTASAIGETGLDYYYDFSPRERQRQLFARQLEACAIYRLPVVIHVREAYDDAFALLERAVLPVGGVLHCFTGGPDECRRALDLGLHISLSGIVTFAGADTLRRAAQLVPHDRLLIETDAPYLAPIPHRGCRNEPALVAHTARFVAELVGVSFAELCRLTRENAAQLFAL
ncbi:MAG: TatD family hydrolase [Deltaproteobacteria bacterium]|nr:TatD family hydrolase [Deltaproteobacteria bacterium]